MESVLSAAFQRKTEAIARVAAMGETTPEADPRKLAEEARDRVRFEEEALELADQVYRVARRLVSTREEAEDLMQETYSRAFRAWRSYPPGTNLRAWLLRILTNLNIDRGRKQQRSPDLQPLEEGDYFLYNRLEEAGREPNVDQERVDERLSQDDVVVGALGRPARLPRRGRARRHRRLQLRRRGADPRHPDRHRHVAPAPWAAYPETRAGRRGGAERLMAYGCEVDPCDEVRGAAAALPRPRAHRRRARRGRGAPRRLLATAASATASRTSCGGSSARRPSRRCRPS